MKENHPPRGRGKGVVWAWAAAYAACTGLVFAALALWLPDRPGGPQTRQLLFCGWVLVLAVAGVFFQCRRSWHSTEETLAQTELERTNQHMREIQLQKRKEQLNALQNQINPHFLYNTLDTIRGLAIEKEALDIANIVATLSSMFKYSMDYADSLVPVGDEIEHLKSFLKIQAIRFPKKFTFEQITECSQRALREVQIPKLVLQPIVENVFTHAFKKRAVSGRITLHLMAADTEFRIMVSDNGAGIRDEQVLALNRMFAAPQDEKNASSGEHSSIALYNIDSRIKMYCGEAYGLHITSTVGYGTTVTVSLPVAG